MNLRRINSDTGEIFTVSSTTCARNSVLPAPVMRTIKFPARLTPVGSVRVYSPVMEVDVVASTSPT